METGISVNNINSPRTGKRSQKTSVTTGQILSKLKKILALHTLSDEKWIKAVSSQYFLIGLAELFKFKADKNSDYATLLDESFSSIKLSYKGGFKIDEKNILIIPDENTKIINCMREEDEHDNYYSRTRLRASLIKYPELIYKNYHYGLMLKISSACNNTIFNAVQSVTLDELFKNSSLDPYGGWYHYRLPWITARILISLKNINISIREDHEYIEKTISEALKSLIDRIDSEYYWRSGAGNWVSKWESTALCLEALYVYNQIDANKNLIDNTLAYILSDSSKNVWLSHPNFDTEQNTNETLASIILSSVLYRLTKKYYKKEFNAIHTCLEEHFYHCLDIIERGDESIVRQYCTIPEILYYTAIAIKGDQI